MSLEGAFKRFSTRAILGNTAVKSACTDAVVEGGFHVVRNKEIVKKRTARRRRDRLDA